MSARDVLRADSAAPPALGSSRTRVLSVLQDAGEPLAVGDIAARVGVHPNTARFHLDALVEIGAVERTTEQRDHPGRPRALYAARPDGAGTGRRSYRLLAEILAGSMAAETPQPSAAAVRAGQEWGRYLADRPPPFRRVDSQAAVRHLVDALDEVGFSPEAVANGPEQQIHLHHCPFREAAEHHRDVVCSVHLGLMQGLLDEIDAPIEATRLEPFVEPTLCIAHVSARQPVPGMRTRQR